MSESDILEWVRSRALLNQYSVKFRPLEDLKGWDFEPTTGNIIHSSGNFFRIEGLDVQIKTPVTQAWQQPIIHQPEIGVLGFIAQRFEGVLHLLVQAKMEPGNINLIQISPTVQATKSNYNQAHGGRKPAFIEYFLNNSMGRVLVDQLQSEQGSRYLKKRNRNVIIQMPDDFVISHSEDYKWVTVGQLQKLMRFPNLVHLDCRSILGSFCYDQPIQQKQLLDEGSRHSFSSKLFDSICTVAPESDLPSVLSWLTQLKCSVEITTRLMPLKNVTKWALHDGGIKHASGNFFAVIGVDVSASNREVASWCQPLIQAIEGGIIGLITQLREGALHFLIQARVEAGLIDLLELAPTLQCTPANYLGQDHSATPHFLELFQRSSSENIRFDSMLSDEGGRFYQSSQKHLVIELQEDANLELPDNYRWMTLGQIQECVQFSNLINIELRSILACLALAD
jgi:oxidase EvaA